MSSTKVHPHHLHGIRVILFGVSLIALCLVRLDSASLSPVKAQGSVLSYATNISRSDLLSETNAARAGQGLAALTLDSRLNASAQNKAQDMVDKNYWSHVSPDGTQPWYFFDAAGYDYKNAGENLAYGFDTSTATVNGWLNSPSHRANIMGDYTDVGFGFVNGASYQGGENTVVVAHYGTPATPPPAPQPTTPSTPPASTPSTLPSSTTPAPATPAPTPPVAEQPVDTPKETEQKADQQADKPPVVVANTEKAVPLWQRLGDGTLPILGVLSLLLIIASTAGYGLTHRQLIKHAWATGESYVIHHPAIDAMTLALITALILLTTTGRIG